MEVSKQAELRAIVKRSNAASGRDQRERKRQADQASASLEVSSDTESMHSAISEPLVSEQTPAALIRTGKSSDAPLPPTPRLGSEAMTMDDNSSADTDPLANEDASSKPGNRKKRKNKKKKKKTATVTVLDGNQDGSQAQENLETEVDSPNPETLDDDIHTDQTSDDSTIIEQPRLLTPPFPAPVTASMPVTSGTAVVARSVPRRQLSGPFLSDALFKASNKGKGEDAWVLRPECAWTLEGQPGEASFGIWGVFDGHGGRQVATYASHSLLKDICTSLECPEVPSFAGPEVSLDSISALDNGALAAGKDDLEEWRLQAELVRRLPWALSQAFIRCNEDACRKFKNGGTTATVAVAVGWELIIANVGDSLAYLDTGVEVLAVCSTHRLQDCQAEVDRVLAAGGEVAPSTVDGKPAGPPRVWPGGLAMGRTIGDVDAGSLVPADPEICQVTIPAEGARLIIGSDGLWDAINAKQAAHHVRDMNAEAAAHYLAGQAIKKDHLKDDVTVIVVDFSRAEDDKLPSALTVHRVARKKNKCGGVGAPKLAHVWHPLQADKESAGHRAAVMTAGAERRRSILAAALAAAEEREELERRRKEYEEELAKQRSAEAARVASEAEGLYAELAKVTLTPAEVQSAIARQNASKSSASGRQEGSASKKPVEKKKKDSLIGRGPKRSTGTIKDDDPATPMQEGGTVVERLPKAKERRERQVRAPKLMTRVQTGGTTVADKPPVSVIDVSMEPIVQTPAEIEQQLLRQALEMQTASRAKPVMSGATQPEPQHFSNEMPGGRRERGKEQEPMHRKGRKCASKRERMPGTDVAPAVVAASYDATGNLRVDQSEKKATGGQHQAKFAENAGAAPLILSYEPLTQRPPRRQRGNQPALTETGVEPRVVKPGAKPDDAMAAHHGESDGGKPVSSQPEARQWQGGKWRGRSGRGKTKNSAPGQGQRPGQGVAMQAT